MTENSSWGQTLKGAIRCGMILMIGIGLVACSRPVSWKEEVRLHDGTQLIVTRSQNRGGFFWASQDAPLSVHKMSFIHPATGETYKWKSEYGSGTNLQLLAVEIVQGVPYIVTTPVGDFAFKKWGQPTPPYVFFKNEGRLWQRVSLGVVPAEIREANLVVDTQTEEKRLKTFKGAVSAEEIMKINAGLAPADQHFRVFVRTANAPPAQVQTGEAPKLVAPSASASAAK